MGKKKKKKLPKSLRKGSLPRPVADVWAAGVGALAQARKKGGESFEALVAVGTTVSATGGKAAQAAIDQVESAANAVADSALGVAGGAAGSVQGGVESVVEGVLARLGVPGRDEVVALQSQVDALQAKIASLAKAPSVAIEDSADLVTVYHVTKHDRGWAVQRAGAERATSVHGTKKEALSDARRTARAHAPSRLVTYKTDGSVSDETEYDTPD